jgi:hypothetical protein
MYIRTYHENHTKILKGDLQRVVGRQATTFLLYVYLVPTSRGETLFYIYVSTISMDLPLPVRHNLWELRVVLEINLLFNLESIFLALERRCHEILLC